MKAHNLIGDNMNFSTIVPVLIYLSNTYAAEDFSNNQVLALEATLTPEESAEWIAYQAHVYGFSPQN